MRINAVYFSRKSEDLSLESRFDQLIEIRNIESLFNDGTELDLKTADGTPMPYEGFVVVEFKLETSSTDRTILVPMLVTHETLDYPNEVAYQIKL
jgi:hypothetical protein